VAIAWSSESVTIQCACDRPAANRARDWTLVAHAAEIDVTRADLQVVRSLVRARSTLGCEVSLHQVLGSSPRVRDGRHLEGAWTDTRTPSARMRDATVL